MCLCTLIATLYVQKVEYAPQERFYGPSVAARQLLSLSPVCKEMRQLVLTLGLPALALQVCVNEHPRLLRLQTVTQRCKDKRLTGNCSVSYMARSKFTGLLSAFCVR